MVRTRIAPSPTGYPHIGTIYQALFNFAFAKKHQGKFLVRIEDTDRNRLVEGSEEVIFAVLDWFNLVEDESVRKDGEYGPYRQSERLAIYHNYAEELINKGHAYFAYYKREEAGKKEDYAANPRVQIITQTDEAPPTSIKEMVERKNWVIRMRAPKDKSVSFQDEIRGIITFEADQITDQVLIKSDGFPTYHLAVVVDDHLMQITHVVRGEEWISSTPKHVLLYDYFGWEKPLFYHTPDLRNPDKSKLSKRHGHTNVNWYKEEGFLHEAVLNYLALLGWSHPEEKEIFSLSEFIKLFDLKDIKPVGPVFDLVKLKWVNQQYLQNKTDDELQQLIINFYPKAKELNKEILTKLMPIVKTRMEILKDFESSTKIFFGYEHSLEKEEKNIASTLLEKLTGISEWNSDMIFTEMKKIMEEKQIRMPVLYKIFTGAERGLPLPQVLEILGKERTLNLLKALT